MANIYDEFTLENVRGIQAAINRAGATKAAIAQDAFLNQRAVQQAEQERRARAASAIDVFRIEQQMLEVKSQRDQRRRWDEEAASLDIDPKGRSDAALLRAIKLKREAEIDRLDRKGVDKKLKSLGVTNPESLDEDDARSMFTMLDEQARINFESRKTEQDATARFTGVANAQRQALEKDKPLIQATLKQMAAEKIATEQRINRLSSEPIDPKQVVALLKQDELAAGIIAKLSPEQKAILDSGNYGLVKQNLKHFWGGSADVKTFNTAIENAKTKIQEGRANEAALIMQEAKGKHTDFNAFFLNKYGPGAFSSDGSAAQGTGNGIKAFPLPPVGAPRPVGALSPEETGFYPELYGGKQAGGAAGYVPGIIPNAFNAVRDIPSNIASGVASSDAGLAVSDVVRALQNKYANARTTLFGGVPQPAPVSSGALSRLMPTVDPSRSIMARTAGALMPSQANVFNLLRQLGLSTPGSTPTVSPWQSGAEAFMVDPRMQGVNPFAPQVATEIPEAYFSVGR